MDLYNQMLYVMYHQQDVDKWNEIAEEINNREYYEEAA